MLPWEAEYVSGNWNIAAADAKRLAIFWQRLHFIAPLT